MSVKTIRPHVAVIDTRAARPAPKTADPIYLSPEWRRLMAEIIAERGRVCEDPGCPRPHSPVARVFGDHIVELADGGDALDRNNVLLRCGAAHTRKTLAERARRAAARA